MKGKKNIAIYQQILTGRQVRGPHVFFPLFNAEYVKEARTKYNLYYFVKTDNEQELQRQYPNGELNQPNVIFLPERNSRFKKIIEIADLIGMLIKYKISLLHIISFTLQDPIYQLKFLQRTNILWRLKYTLSITYNAYPAAFKSGYTGRFAKYIEKDKLFRSVKFDGIYSWYDDVIDWVEKSGIFPNQPITRAIESRFCDIKKFHPESKQKIIVWAGALVSYKQPEMFIEALYMIRSRNADALKGWHVVISGNGDLEEQIKKMIIELGLTDLVEMRDTSTAYHELLNHSILHVSTQSLDHFPSLVTNEAMASGCAVIATNVGRAHLFVKDMKNGYLTATEDAKGVADSLEQFLLLNDAERKAMMDYSRELCETVHTPSNFIRGIDHFWTEVLAK